MKVSPAYLAKYVSDMKADEGRFGCDKAAHPKTIIVDYGGANVAKPLHVGHLRSAVIGESIKRIGKFMGHHMIGDVHLGDWGLQMGLIIVELKERKPDLVYYDESYTGEYPKEAPFTISELEDIYPTASKKSKEDEAFREAAMEATSQLQAGRRGYRALLAHILDVSVTDLKKNYDNLNVSFELWKGESDAQPYIPDIVPGKICPATSGSLGSHGCSELQYQMFHTLKRIITSFKLYIKQVSPITRILCTRFMFL